MGAGWKNGGQLARKTMGVRAERREREKGTTMDLEPDLQSSHAPQETAEIFNKKWATFRGAWDHVTFSGHQDI